MDPGLRRDDGREVRLWLERWSATIMDPGLRRDDRWKVVLCSGAA
ncbi:MAG: hypothetical protein RL001_1461 [Pseudomonadota bacterium]|jgi:hypothetical protein